MVTCPRCGASRGDGDRFCAACGAPLGGCPSCGEPVSPGDRFCRACGHQLSDLAPASSVTPSSAPAAGQARAAERRVCSVLFCDLVGFTPLSESRDPEAVRELLSRYFEVARTVIGRYGGVVEKFIGDAVMAVWGTPVTAEGDAERAVRAALDMVSAIAELGEQAGLPGLAARAGVVTGEVAVTLGATGEGMVAGDAVNTAARVQAAAEPGQVLVDGSTRRLADSVIGFADAGEHALKGKTEPEPLWRATWVLSGGAGGMQRVDGLEAPLTGRDVELRTVRDLFHAAADRRVPRMVLVSGPAGVGKSRLGWEFRKYIDGLVEVAWWHRGRCLSYGDGVAYWALAEMVRQRLGIAEEDPAETAAAKLAAGLDRYVPDPGERAYAGARLGRLIGVPVPGDAAGAVGREELFAGWRLFFERLATVHPVVLVVEDAQYADAGLLDFLDYLIDWVRDLPVYVLVFARPELGHARPGFGTGRNRTALTLDPLDAASMDQLVDALVPGMPRAARAKITAQAQGIPLFAVETIRSLVDRDIVQPIEGSYRLVGSGRPAAGAREPARAAGRPAGCPEPGRAAAGRRRRGAGHHVPGRGADRGVRAGRSRGAGGAGRAGPPGGAVGVGGPAVPGAGQLRVRPGHAAPGRLRHAVPAGPQGPAPGGGRAPARRVPRRRRGSRRGDRPALPGRAGRGARRRRRRADPRPGHRRADPGGRPGRAHRCPRPGRRQLRRRRPAHPGRAPQTGSKPPPPRCGNTPPRPPSPVPTGPRRSSRPARPRMLYREGGGTRAAARAQAIAGQALRRWGRHAQAREQLTAAVEVLRDDPDADTVRALGELAALEVFAGSPAADALSAEALALGQDLAVDEATLASLFTTRGICHGFAGRRPQAASYFREAARLAEQAGDTVRLGRALAQPVRRGDRHRPRRRRGGRPRRRRPAAPGRRPRPARVRGREPGPGAADDRRLGRRRGRAGPGRRRRRPGRHRVPGLLPGLGWRRCAARPPPPRRSWPGWATCGPAKTPRTRRSSRSRRRSPPPRSASPPPRCATPAPPWTTPTPWGSAPRTCGGPGRWPPAPPTTWPTPPPPASCWPCWTATGPGSWPPCSGPNATWPAPAWPPTATRTPARRSPPRSPGCASTPPPTTWPTACSTTPPT